MNRTTTKKIINNDVRNKNKQSQEHSIQIIFKELISLEQRMEINILMLPVHVFLLHVCTCTKLTDIFTQDTWISVHAFYIFDTYSYTCNADTYSSCTGKQLGGIGCRGHLPSSLHHDLVDCELVSRLGLKHLY